MFSNAGIGTKAKRSSYPKKITQREYEVIKQIFAAGNRLFLQLIWHKYSRMVDTGMSLASLIPLQKALRAGGSGAGFKYAMLGKLRFPTTKSSGQDKKKYNPNTRDGKSFPGMGEYKSKAHGERLGATGFKIDYGSVNKMVFYFDFDIKVMQLYLNENLYMPILKEAHKAREDFIKQELKDLPKDINKFLLTGVGVYSI